MEGEEERSNDTRAFNNASIPKRILIVAAGATVNIIFGLIVYYILMASTGTFVTNEIDNVIDSYVAQNIGLQNGDKIVEIDSQKINNKYDLDKVMKKITGDTINLKIQRNNEELSYDVKPTEIKTKATGMYLDEKCKIVALEKGSSGEKQGLEANDVLLKINGEEINENRQKAIELIHQENQEKLLIVVERNKKEVEIELKPDYISTYYLGVNLKQAEGTLLNRCIYAGIETKEFGLSIIDNLKKLFTGNVGVDQMMGPVGISEVIIKTNGLQDFIYLLALISLSLGVTNLLPIPALDGGKILILLIEAIRKKPLKEQTEINLQLLGFSILIALTIFVTYNDIIRIF